MNDSTTTLLDGIERWRTVEGTKRLVFYALIISIFYPFLYFDALLLPIGFPNSLPLRLATAAFCLLLAGSVMLFTRLRPFADRLQVLSVGALIVSSLTVFINAQQNALCLAGEMLAIFGTQRAFLRKRHAAVTYGLGLAYLFAYSAYRGMLGNSLGFSTTVVVAIAFIVSFVLAATYIGMERTEVIGRIEASTLAHIDVLTGLQSRVALFARIDSALASAKRRGHHLALLYIDLDGFKGVNDHYGHHAGDDVLAQFGERLRQLVRSDETAARIGGDEFVVVLPHVDAPTEPELVVERVERALEEPFTVAGTKVRLGASIGIARAPVDGTSRDRLIANADAAMYVRKRARPARAG